MLVSDKSSAILPTLRFAVDITDSCCLLSGTLWDKAGQMRMKQQYLRVLRHMHVLLKPDIL